MEKEFLQSANDFNLRRRLVAHLKLNKVLMLPRYYLWFVLSSGQSKGYKKDFCH
jgi:hypothetical protein